MRHSRLLTRSVCLATTVALCACGSSSSSSSSSSSPTPTQSPCQYTSDSVVAESPVVDVLPPGSKAPQPVSKDTSLPLACDTLLTVVKSGSAQAMFGSQGLCQLTQYQGQLARLISRDPDGDLLTLQAGHLTCSVNGPVSLPPSTVQCPYGKVIAQRAQYFDICAPTQSSSLRCTWVWYTSSARTGKASRWNRGRNGHSTSSLARLARCHPNSLPPTCESFASKPPRCTWADRVNRCQKLPLAGLGL